MAYQVGNECYPDMASSLDAYVAAKTGELYTNSGGEVWNITAARSGETAVVFTGTPINAVGVAWTKTQAITFPECRKLSASDGVAVGWMIFGVLLGAYAVQLLRRGL